MLSSAAFLVRHPEFANVDADLVASALTRAEDEIDATVWGDLTDEGHALLAAHKLAMTPAGQDAHLRAGGGANQTSIYWQQYEDLRQRVGTAYRPIIDDPGIVP